MVYLTNILDLKSMLIIFQWTTNRSNCNWVYIHVNIHFSQRAKKWTKESWLYLKFYRNIHVHACLCGFVKHDICSDDWFCRRPLQQWWLVFTDKSFWTTGMIVYMYIQLFSKAIPQTSRIFSLPILWHIYS